MEVKELRIGNFVFDKDEKIETVHEISKYGDLYRINELDPDYFSPISLTEEWLLKFGFEIKNKDTFHLICDGPFNIGLTFDLPSKNIGLISKASGFQYIDVAVDYVHQLQNLFFALKGKELTLKN